MYAQISSASPIHNNEYNGTYQIVVTAPNAFTYTVSGTPQTPAKGKISAGQASVFQEITSLTSSGTTATATLPGHGYANGSFVVVSGVVATQNEYNTHPENGSQITVLDVNTFTYVMSGTTTTPARGVLGGYIGKQMDNMLIYNNLIYGNQQSGIICSSNRASILGMKILNNTIVGNGDGAWAVFQAPGIQISAGSPHSTTINEFSNNIVSENVGGEIDLNSEVTITTAQNNLIYHSAGGNFITYGGTPMNFATWQGLSFESGSLNVDPDLNATTYIPESGSPVIGAGVTQTEFTTDMNGDPQTSPWTIGALVRP
jgi:hypothetical protein